jgi:hypothetical membrane protein
MTQLARPDPARHGSAGNRPGSVGSSATEASLPGGLRCLAQAPAFSSASSVASSRPDAFSQTPFWVVIAALLTPVVLVSGWLIAGSFQPASYSPMQQTMSVLAGQTGAHRWFMTGALFLVAGCQLLTGVGLTSVRPFARILLILAALSTIGVATSPETATGPTAQHLAFAASCVVTTAIWPLFVARRSRARPWVLNIYPCAAVTALFAGLIVWLLIATHGGGGLGLVERLDSAAQGLFPFIVALGLWQTGRSMRSRQPERLRQPADEVVVPVPQQRSRQS